MAGIGFELRRVLADEKITNKFLGYTAALSITTGPMLVSIIQLLLMSKLLEYFKVTEVDIEIIKTTIMYVYVFSMVVTSGFINVVTRYLADRLFEAEVEDILASLIGILALVIGIGGVISFIFLALSPLTFMVKLLSHIFFIEMVILYTLMSYISAVKDIKRVALGYGIGFLVSIIATMVLLFLKLDPILAALTSIIIGYFINTLILTITIKDYFQTVSINIFSFMPYFKIHYRLFLANLFYTLGIFVHNFIFWRFSNLSTMVGGTYVYAPLYDSATFFAVLTTIPASLIFVVRFETVFYEKYKIFIDTVLGQGTLRDIKRTKSYMLVALDKEFSYIFGIQFITSILAVLLGLLLVLLGFTENVQLVTIYSFLCIGFFMSYIIFINIIVLLYFDLQDKALIIGSLFLGLNIVFSLATIYLGPSYYGLGYCLANILVYVASRVILDKELKIIDYKLFVK